MGRPMETICPYMQFETRKGQLHSLMPTTARYTRTPFLQMTLASSCERLYDLSMHPLSCKLCLSI